MKSTHKCFFLYLPRKKMRSRRSIKKQKCKTKALNTTRYLRSHSASYKHSASLPGFSRGSSSSDNYFLSAHKVQVQNNIHFPLPVLNQGTVLLCTIKQPSCSTTDPVKPLVWLNNPDLWQKELGEEAAALVFKKESTRLQHQCVWLSSSILYYFQFQIKHFSPPPTPPLQGGISDVSKLI